MKKSILISLLVIITFLFADYGWDAQKALNLVPEGWSSTSSVLFIRLFWQLLIPCILLVLLYELRNLPRELGLNKGFKTAAWIAFLGTLPMLIGFAIFSKGQVSITWSGFLFGALLAALIEEILFRAFLFGQLFRRAGWGFVPAALLAALIFGSAHLYQSNDFNVSLGIFMITCFGSLWFSWLYVEWNFNLWVPIGFHFLMNLYWDLFEIDNTALGDVWANVLRAMTIALSIILTIRMKRKSKQAYTIQKSKLLKNT